jgi:hypothetical protein
MRHWCQLSDSSAGKSSCKPRSLIFPIFLLFKWCSIFDLDSLFPQAISAFADCCEATAIFQEAGAMPQLRCRDINFFIAAISIFSSPQYQFFFAAMSIFSSARYQFFLRPDIDFFAPSRRYSFGLTAAPHHGNIHSALQPRPIMALFLWPYSRAPSRRYSFGLTAAPHHGDIPSALQPLPITAIFLRPYSRALHPIIPCCVCPTSPVLAPLRFLQFWASGGRRTPMPSRRPNLP